MTPTPQWELPREIEMTQKLLFYSQRMRRRESGKNKSN